MSLVSHIAWRELFICSKYVATTTQLPTPNVKYYCRPYSKMSAESHFEDPSQHPKFNPVLGQIERHRRPRKTAVPNKFCWRRMRIRKGEKMMMGLTENWRVLTSCKSRLQRRWLKNLRRSYSSQKQNSQSQMNTSILTDTVHPCYTGRTRRFKISQQQITPRYTRRPYKTVLDRV